METKGLGNLERVELRRVWRHEAADFTPWLAAPEGLRLLATTLGMPEDGLELVAQEQAVGPFSADIVCRNTTDNSLVLIENQLERTDHRHLGQLLTYAAGLDAAYLVWTAASFTAEHRAALDWLNRMTDEGLRFFGLEVELWQIGDSMPAPKLNVVVQPNDWLKLVREQRHAIGLSETDQVKIEFWKGFAEYMEATGTHFRRPRLDRAWNWHGWGLGRSYFQLAASVNVRDGHNAVWVNLAGPQVQGHFEALLAQREAIEEALGFAVEWEAGERERKIIVRREGETGDRERWPRQYAWLLDTMTRFERVFRPRIAALVVEGEVIGGEGMGGWEG